MKIKGICYMVHPATYRLTGELSVPARVRK